MYTLRTVTSGNKQINQSIGNEYAFIERDFNYDEFSDTFRMLFGKNHVADLDETSDEHTKNVFGFIQWSGQTVPLYKDNAYYIMTESGKTFNNLSYR